MMMFSVLSEQFYFSSLFSTFSNDKLPLQSLVFALIGGISGCLCFLSTLAVLHRGQLPFPRMFLVPRPSSQAHSSRLAGLCLPVFLSRHFLLLSNFHLLTRPLLWLLTSPSENNRGKILSCCVFNQFSNVMQDIMFVMSLLGYNIRFLKIEIVSKSRIDKTFMNS